MSEVKPKTEICECCDEEWEEDFFCQSCSDEGHLEEWDESVSTEFDIDGPPYTTVMQQELVYYRTCLNCCWCGVRKASAGSTTQGFVDDEEIPF